MLCLAVWSVARTPEDRLGRLVSKSVSLDGVEGEQEEA